MTCISVGSSSMQIGHDVVNSVMRFLSRRTTSTGPTLSGRVLIVLVQFVDTFCMSCAVTTVHVQCRMGSFLECVGMCGRSRLILLGNEKGSRAGSVEGR